MFGMQEQLAELSLDNDHTLFPEAKKSALDAAFNATNDTKSHQVYPRDSSKTVNVSSSLSSA